MKDFIDPLGAGVNVVFYVKQPQCVRQAYGLVAYGFPWSIGVLITYVSRLPHTLNL